MENPSILIADSEALSRFALADCLSDHGFKVYEAADGAEALGILSHAPDIGLVFADVSLWGGRSSLDLARWVRDERPGLCVLLTSGKGRCADFAGGAATRFFDRPYDPETIVTAITAIVRPKLGSSAP